MILKSDFDFATYLEHLECLSQTADTLLHAEDDVHQLGPSLVHDVVATDASRSLHIRLFLHDGVVLLLQEFYIEGESVGSQ